MVRTLANCGESRVLLAFRGRINAKCHKQVLSSAFPSWAFFSILTCSRYGSRHLQKDFTNVRHAGIVLCLSTCQARVEPSLDNCCLPKARLRLPMSIWINGHP